MPKKASGNFDQKEYVKAYHREFRIEKKVTFNRKSPDDMALLEWLEGQPEGTVQYLKRLIREDMGQAKAIESMNERSAKVRKELSGITFPAVDGYRDEQACKEMLEKGHTVFIDIVDHWEVRIDVEAKKVLTVRDMLLIE